jgi:hypothetical protein
VCDEAKKRGERWLRAARQVGGGPVTRRESRGFDDQSKREREMANAANSISTAQEGAGWRGKGKGRQGLLLTDVWIRNSAVWA